jgi:hypothetical protein
MLKTAIYIAEVIGSDSLIPLTDNLIDLCVEINYSKIVFSFLCYGFVPRSIGLILLFADLCNT